MEDSKTAWRARLLGVRRSIDPGARRQASAAVVRRIVATAAFAGARSVLLYAAIGGELDPHAVALHAYRAGKDVYLPGSALEPCAWTRVAGADLAVVPGDHTTLTLPSAPVLLVAPGVGFDLQGTRLGRGGGFYDRAIAELRRAGEATVVGIGYDAQIVESLPRDPWDQSVDVVVTELRVLAPDATAPRVDRADWRERNDA